MARKKFEEEEIEANLLPVMNVMFLMIPALLMAMEFAQMASINVSPPKFAAAAQQKDEQEKKDEKPLNLKVFVMEDGFRVSADGQQEGAEAGKSQDSKAPTIGLAKQGAPLNDYERYDYAQLESKAKSYKQLFPNEVVVTVSAEANIPMQSIIMTMDALAGTKCKIAKSLKGGEKIPDECYFWQPIVEGGAS
ncbi:biopolymer transporter ExbD [Nannocystis sp. ILAH1]|uniref:ExbD/TolR family protein n=1 Tax=unclassified Nannocystis TaxID=2627009 RepID=UPI00226EB404|nr:MULTISPECIES: biopolymer transporter ExbD [unclassified Nannocystis]MCY0986832.1 biopolymer transporter ExbD [Nannocystis sp. ILAH1]MCY1071713.1 biopolymer transporter ExbD [Nannocystis sp. RBIL2]